MKLRYCRPRISALLGTLLLGYVAVAGAADEPPADEGRKAIAAAVQAEDQKGIFGAAPVVDLTPEILYQFMFAEIAGARGQIPLSVAAYLDLARSTRDPQIAKRAAEVALGARQYDAALSATRIWVEQDPNSVAAQQMMVTLAAAFGRLDEVSEHLARSLALDPDGVPGALMRLNRLLARVQDKTAVYKVVVDASEPYLQLPEAHFARAQAAYAAKDMAQAQADIDQALAMRPNWEFAILFKAMLAQANAADVVSILQPFVRAYPEAMDARLGLARALVAERRFDEALSEFKTVQAQQPMNPDVIYAVGLLSMQAHDLDTAEAQLTRLIDMNYSESNLVRTYLGQIAEEKKDFKAAANWYAGVTPSAQYMPAQSRAAQLTAKLGDFDGARAILHKIKPKDEATQVQLILAEAGLLREANRNDEAYAFLNKSLTARPSEPELLYETALAADRISKFEIAEQLWQKLIKIKPDHAHAYNALGYSMAERGVRLEEAQHLIDKALALQPDDPFILDSKGWVQFRLGNKQAALETLQKAFNKRPDPEIAAHLGEVLWSLGRKDDARKVWADAARQSPGNQALADTIKKYLP
ncbi:MAG: tetratricopeptide repeat protein [Rhodocyclaceae bacterium]|nr:tetratricopeptide repeat protein [Rhodocyclaceae bacterium]